ncbi:MAG: NAD(P)-dependent oxidoreductase [Candidatus Sericytochromatia bacterium]|nr:NAD(P)-dependent oxidoreductase [Candidatus Sericytochromatia bacterium]
MTDKVGFVGVGRMGANMARRLKDRGFPVVALYDVNVAAAESLATELGAQACTSLSDVTALSDVVITVVSDDAAMRAIFFGPGDNLLVGATDRLFINCATLTPGIHQALEHAAQAVGARTLEACMASSITQAREGTLYLICGGDPLVFEQAKPVLDSLSASQRFVGPAGDAAKVKALVNMVMNMNTAALAEGLALGDALGLDLAVLREVFAQTGANSRVLQTDADDMQNRDYDCFFSAAHAAKDAGIAVQLGREAGLVLPLADATWQQYQRLVTAGMGEIDKSGIAELTFKGRLGADHPAPAH